MIYIIAAFGFISIMIIIAKAQAVIQFNREVSLLFSLSKAIPGKTFEVEQLTNYVRIKHDGQFKPGLDKEWISIKGEQYATTEKPGFIWKGTTAAFIARDMFIADKGRLVVSLFSLFNIIDDAKGEQYNQGELLRWLGEGILYPTNLLPSDRLQWSEVDEETAK